MNLTVEEFWDNLLSREPKQVLLVWGGLSAEEQMAVWQHLQRIVTEEGWMDSQRVSAKAALAALNDVGLDPT